MKARLIAVLSILRSSSVGAPNCSSSSSMSSLPTPTCPGRRRTTSSSCDDHLWHRHLLEWEMLFPDRRDFINLTPLPVRLRTVFAAKLASFLRVHRALLGGHEQHLFGRIPPVPGPMEVEQRALSGPARLRPSRQRFRGVLLHVLRLRLRQLLSWPSCRPRFIAVSRSWYGSS